MKRSMSDKAANDNQAAGKRHDRFVPFLILGIFAIAIVGIGAIAFYGSSRNVHASSKETSSSNQDKKFIATRDIVVDQTTGRLRKPNEQELKELVDSLTEMTKRSVKDQQPVSLRNGGEALALDGAFQGVVLGRPNPDGTTETRCVFTFEEAAEFLGLVRDDS